MKRMRSLLLALLTLVVLVLLWQMTLGERPFSDNPRFLRALFIVAVVVVPTVLLWLRRRGRRAGRRRSGR